MLKNILKGIKAYSNSLQLIGRLKLWKYFFIPIGISFVTAITIGFLSYGLSDNIGMFIAKIWIWDWGKETFTTFSTFVGAVAILVIGLSLFKHIVMALSAPFLSTVSEKMETHYTGKQNLEYRNTSFKEQLWRGIRINGRNLGKELLLTLPLLLLSFLPIVGIFSTVLLFLMQAYYAGFGNMDYTLERHYTYKESIRFVKKNKGYAIGNGIVFMLVLLIPFFGILFVLPLSVTAASKQTLEILKQNPMGELSSNSTMRK